MTKNSSHFAEEKHKVNVYRPMGLHISYFLQPKHRSNKIGKNWTKKKKYTENHFIAFNILSLTGTDILANKFNRSEISFYFSTYALVCVGFLFISSAFILSVFFGVLMWLLCCCFCSRVFIWDVFVFHSAHSVHSTKKEW